MMGCYTPQEARDWLAEKHSAGKSLGFVPTMGALHDGHIALVERAVRENDLSAVSIFVNPIQFNNPEDLEKYPRTLEKDLEMLEKAGCDMVFIPTPEGMYPEAVQEKYHFGALEEVMEGALRPGHFNGVAVVVKRLFEMIRPQRAYFGEKDFQQLRIIQQLVMGESIPVEIVPCPIVRETDGLAMSSRNRRLSPEERKHAPAIYEILRWAKTMAGKVPVDQLCREAEARLNAVPGMKTEYFILAETDTLQAIHTWDEGKKGIAAFVALWLGEVRLIDNMLLIS
jgi:pantoate--beta-alanine ligase